MFILIRRYIVFLVCCWLTGMLPVQAQTLAEQYADMLRSEVNDREKVDSLFRFGYTAYMRDYDLFERVGEAMHRLAEAAAYPEGMGKAANLLALVAEGRGDLVAMAQYTREAMAIFEVLPPGPDLAIAQFALGTYFRRKKQSGEATEQFIACLRLAESLRDTVMMAKAYTSLGIIDVGEQNYARALAYYDQTLQLAQAARDWSRVQRTYTNMGIVYMRQGRFDESIASHNKALDMARELGVERDEAFVYNDLGSVYFLSGYDLQKAIDYLRRAIAIRERINERIEIAYTYNYLGQVYRQLGNLKEAERWMKKGLQMAVETSNSKQTYEGYHELSILYAQFGHHDSAYRYLNKYTGFRDSLRLIEKAETIDELTARYESEKKEQQIEVLTQQTTIQQLGLQRRNLFLLATFLLLVLASAMAYMIHRNKKARERQFLIEAELKAELLRVEAQHTLQQDRLRISRELHDNIGSHLTFIKSAVDDATEGDAATMQQVKTIASDTIRELRKTVWLINRSSVSLEEFVVKLREYVALNTKIVVVLRMSDDVMLKSTVATHVFRMVQEAVNNALKYGEASLIQVDVEHVSANKVKICVIDNGVGFDPEKVTAGCGLANMRSRAEAVGGKLRIRSARGKGTVVEIRFTVDA